MIYYVTFQTQKNRTIKDIMFHCEAKNAKEAVAIAKEAWVNKGRKEHQFHLYAHKSSVADQKYLSVRTWVNKPIEGVDVMDRFICTDIHEY